MNARLFFDLTPANGWTFTALGNAAKSVEKQSDWVPWKNGKTHLLLPTTSTATNTVEMAVSKVVHKLDDDRRFVRVDPFEKEVWLETPRAMMGHMKRKLVQRLAFARAEGRSLIVGFSLIGGQQVFDTLELMRFLREASEGSALCVAGGSLLSYRHPLLEADLFAAGADIINIAGVRAFAQWVGTLTRNDPIERDEEGRVHITLPPDASFFTALTQNRDVPPGRAVAVPPSFDLRTRDLNVHLPGVGCANQKCGFCATGPHIHAHKAAAQKKIPLWAAMTQALLDVKPKNGAAKIRGLSIGNSNPMQRMGALRTFLDGVDLSGVEHIGHFGEAPSFLTRAGVDRHLAYIDEVLTRYPHLNLFLGLSLDAIQYENDNDFLHKSLGPHVLDKRDYETVLAHYFAFLREARQRPWHDRFSIRTNIITHPAMTPDVYLRKQALRAQIDEAFGRKSDIGDGPLDPFEGSAIAAAWQGHFAPMHFMEKDWELGWEINAASYLSHWGNQFKNGDLLDCTLLCQLLAAHYDLPALVILSDLLVRQWNGVAPDKLPPEAFARYESLGAPRSFVVNAIQPDVQHILSFQGPRLVPLLEMMLGHLKKTGREEGAEAIFQPARDFHALLDWFNRRERYLMQANETYANDPNTLILVKATAGMMKSFGPLLPAFAKADQRPTRRIPPNAPLPSLL
jgi:hypothetical protein